ncbi:hypothetical protein C1645_875659 [Glomus cerebriforme]|uniref:Uncharacterized protein n=1 Tax=Glomus cerebriforme TaxID=658196 RepID=A0A397T7T0_9GLOM|nr:hypothetical protein C1645_875659 [Glomus cerebriforme]
MKFNILLIGGLLLLLIGNINADITGPCQTVINKAWEKQAKCSWYLNLLTDIAKKYNYNFLFSHPISYDTTLYNKAIEDACAAEFSCTFEEASQIWNEILNNCPTELSTKVDWNANPNYLDNSIIEVYATLLAYYTVIPEHNSVCHKTTSGELCGVESGKQLVDWVKMVAPEGNATIAYTHELVYKEDGTSLPIPRELFQCGECTTNMVQEYGNWINQHTVPVPIITNIFPSLDIFTSYFTCPIDFLIGN